MTSTFQADETSHSAASNILDVPNFFWDSEPTLHPLYAAVREYLEIDPRIKVLNERCRVFLDLAEILSDSVADSKMSAITWIIIILIIVSILVTVTEVVLRFAMLQRSSNTPEGHPPVIAPPNAILTQLSSDHQPPPSHLLLQMDGDAPQADDNEGNASPLSDLEILARTLGLQGNASLGDIQQGIWELRQRDASCATPLA